MLLTNLKNCCELKFLNVAVNYYAVLIYILLQERFVTGHSLGGRAPLTPMEAAQWCFEAKKAPLPSYENTWVFSFYAATTE